MATTNIIPEMQPATEPATAPRDRAVRLLVALSPAYTDATPESLQSVLDVLQAAFGSELASHEVAVAYPSSTSNGEAYEAAFTMLPFVPETKARTDWVQMAASFAGACRVAAQVNAECVLLLGAEAHTLSPSALQALARVVLAGNVDLALPRYSTRLNEALLNTALLYPLMRSVYGVDLRMPLALDLAMSKRMCVRMASAAQRITPAMQEQAILWAAAEAAVAGFTTAEVQVGLRALPQPTDSDLSAVIALVAGSLFADVEARASYWQRTRPAVPVTRVSAFTSPPSLPNEPIPEASIAELVESFRLAYGNLQEIWSLVLPPNSVLGLKRLSMVPVENFRMQDSLWVRVVYDFVLAYRLRTINRGHLMGALTPLYLAWVASHANVAHTAAEAETHVQELARAFEADKPYLVSRWRWPDRFNP